MKQATFLKFAAVAIAAPRYIGAFGTSLGVRANEQLDWLLVAELYTGGAMAILEGFALAFILGKIRLLNPATHQARQLKLFAWLIAGTMPLVALPYLLTEQNGVAVNQLISNPYLMFFTQIAWSTIVLCVPVLVVMAVGYADYDEAEQQIHQAETRATIKQTKQAIEQAAEQNSKQVDSKYVCPYCNEPQKSQKAVSGHLAHCKQRPAKSVAHSNGTERVSKDGTRAIT